MKKGNVLEIKDLSVDFMTVRGIVYAVQGVDLEVKQEDFERPFAFLNAVPAVPCGLHELCFCRQNISRLNQRR